MNVNKMRMTKKPIPLASLLEGLFVCYVGKNFFFDKVGDEQLNEKYSD